MCHYETAKVGREIVEPFDSLIPAWLLAVAYIIVAVFTVTTSRRDVSWMTAARMFLAVVLFAWAGFHLFVEFTPDSNINRIRSLSRWLHVPNVVAISLMVVARWYHNRQWGTNE